ncbi:MAG: Arc family DNA-binding protein [Roseiarcus sp.]
MTVAIVSTSFFIHSTYMVRTPISERIADIPPYGLRLTPDLKQRIEASARANSRSLNAEITARLEHSFRAELPVAPETAIEALTLAQGIVAALREVCDDVFIDRLPDATQSLFLRLGERLAALEKPVPKEKE